MKYAFSVYIDGENISHNYYESIVSEINKRGEIVGSIAVYGDMSKIEGWRVLEKNQGSSIIKIEHVSQNLDSSKTTKQASDNEMMMDIMESVCNHSRTANAVALVSSDKGFGQLVERIKKHHIRVLGIMELKASIDNEGKPSWYKKLFNDTFVIETNNNESQISTPSKNNVYKSNIQSVRIDTENNGVNISRMSSKGKKGFTAVVTKHSVDKNGTRYIFMKSDCGAAGFLHEKSRDFYEGEFGSFQEGVQLSYDEKINNANDETRFFFKGVKLIS